MAKPPLNGVAETEYTKSHIRGLSTLLYISPCRLAATGASKVRRPSHYSLTTATGSKRSRADSDLLLCHVGLWRTSRFKFGCMSWCEHSEIGLILNSSVIALTIFTPAMHFQRACRQCVHESARLSRVICSHAWYSRDFGECKTADFCFILCRMHLPRMARATNSCTRKVFFKREESPLK